MICLEPESSWGFSVHRLSEVTQIHSGGFFNPGRCVRADAFWAVVRQRRRSFIIQRRWRCMCIMCMHVPVSCQYPTVQSASCVRLGLVVAPCRHYLTPPDLLSVSGRRLVISAKVRPQVSSWLPLWCHRCETRTLAIIWRTGLWRDGLWFGCLWERMKQRCALGSTDRENREMVLSVISVTLLLHNGKIQMHILVFL